MARDGWWFVGPALLVCVFGLVGVTQGHLWAWWIAVPGLAAVCLFAFFFRDPERTPPTDPDVVVANADGKIVVVNSNPDGATQIDTFLSVLNVHVNRAPVDGTIRESVYHPGRFHVAYRPEAADNNERHDLVIDGTRGTIRAAQIAGVLARRIVCRPKTGDRLRIGERIGLIKFGSRTQIIVPAGYEPVVKLGDRVRGGETVIARWTESSDGTEEPAGSTDA